MSDIELPELPKETLIYHGQLYSQYQMREYARAAVEAYIAKQPDYESMFMSAAIALADIHEALGLDPDDSEGAGPILEEIAAIKQSLAQSTQAAAPDVNASMRGVKALLGCTEGELECIGPSLLDEYINQVNSIFFAILHAMPELVSHNLDCEHESTLGGSYLRWCEDCGEITYSYDGWTPAADLEIEKAERATRVTWAKSNILAFGCCREANNDKRCESWCGHNYCPNVKVNVAPDSEKGGS